jgi:hypothetical protein
VKFWLGVAVGRNVAPGSYMFLVTGSSGGLMHSTPVKLDIESTGPTGPRLTGRLVR